MNPPLQLHHAGEDSALHNLCSEALRRAGVELRRKGDAADDDDDDAPRGSALVLVESTDERALSLVRKLARRGAVLAMSLAPRNAAELFSLIDAGAVDVVFGSDAESAAARASARLSRLARVRELMASPEVTTRAVGDSPAWRAVLHAVVETAAFTDAPVLIMGDTGTGKEQLAQVVHALDPRPHKGELVVVDCTTLTPELAGSELFGHERGAFTGATAAREGAFALSDGGTLFLDEVGELPLPLQAQLLRAIQEQQYKRVGSNAWQRARFRLLCATNRDLETEVSAGRFRSDLYFRIAGCVCRTPPLRERREDILALATHFLRELAPEAEGEMDAGVKHYLLTRDYPGNVRDLRQTVARLCYRHAGPGPLTIGDIPPAERAASTRPQDAWPDPGFVGAVSHAVELGIGLKELGQAAAETAVDIALAKEEGSLAKAANRLGVTPRALQLRLVGRRAAE